MTTEGPEDRKARWERDTLAPSLDHMQERQGRFVSGSGRPIDRLYTGDGGVPDGVGYPGEFPYTRGIHPTMYRSRQWTVRQYAGFGTADQANARFHQLLSEGTTGLSVAFDLPTQLGYDSDHPLSAGEVGRVGVAVDTVADVERLFVGIDLGRISTSMTINATAPILLAMYVTAARRKGVEPSDLTGTVQNDLLKEFVARGTHIFPPAPSIRLATDVIEYCTRSLPGWNPVSVSGYHMREAGATAVQEIAFTLAHAFAYVQAALDRGLEIDAFAPRLSFFFAAHTDLFEEAAKFRAARRLYARTMRDRFGAQDPRSRMLRFHTQTGGVTLTAQQPDNNVVRVALQALAAVLGGTQSLHTNARDEAHALPTEDSVRLALRTQQILAHESGAADTVDPLAGSYYVEALTDQLESEAEELLREIEERGGAVRAVEEGYVQRQIEESAYRYGQAVESGERIIVGVNRYLEDGPTGQDYFRLPAGSAEQQVKGLERIRSERDRTRVMVALEAVEEAARGTANLMPAVLEAVDAYATVGEIADRLRAVFGEYARA